ncbi:MAG: flagellar FlbD family protein [Actinobacteria bacterium]|jgi:flagellar protein FlbD|nr:flagellar FlbD family protein [Actinomycetota bacterium]
MIQLTRINGEKMLINAELIERAEERPDTVVTLTDGTKYVVSESIAEVEQKVQMYKAAIMAMAQRMMDDPGMREVHLRLLYGEEGNQEKSEEADMDVTRETQDE